MLKFIDLFAGLGGFHKALHELGHECVFASEIDPVLRTTYQQNWDITPSGDIRDIVENRIKDIPEHDVLCAGFPCQPFSKAGKQLGRKDKNNGTLFGEIVRILEFRKPKYFILENVPFIRQHDNEETWKYMESEFERLNYYVDHRNYSPHEFGIPQHRLRIFIVGSREPLSNFCFDKIDEFKTEKLNITNCIEQSPKSIHKLPQKNIECLELWQEFISRIPKTTPLPGFPIWGMEFGATYPYNGKYPHTMSAKELGEYKGNFGVSLKGLTKPQQMALLPSYTRVNRAYPDWKKRYIEQNREFYKSNRKYVSNTVKKISELPSQSWQKLEWNVGNAERNITKYILQFRASGIRVKKVDYFPSLVCTNTQIPIIGWQERYISRTEGLKLQSLENLTLPVNDNAAFRALGNAVNSHIVKLIAKELLKDEVLTEPLKSRRKK